MKNKDRNSEQLFRSYWSSSALCLLSLYAYRMRSLAVSHSFVYFRTVGLSDPIRCVLKHGTGHAV